MCKMQNAENEYKESVQTYVSELQFRKQYSSLRIMHSVPLNHIYSEYTIKAQQFELLRLSFFLYQCYQATGFREMGSVMHRAPPPPRTNSAEWIVTTHFA